MMGFAPLTTGRNDLKRDAPTDLDVYAMWEFGEPSARPLLAWRPSCPEGSATRDAPAEVGLLRRLTQAIASFLL